MRLLVAKCDPALASFLHDPRKSVLSSRLFRRTLRQKVGENKSIAVDDLADRDRHSPAEHRPRTCEGVELAVFTAGIDLTRKCCEKIAVEAASSKRALEPARIDAGQKSG